VVVISVHPNHAYYKQSLFKNCFIRLANAKIMQNSEIYFFSTKIMQVVTSSFRIESVNELITKT
jgi:hypothetical protein